MKPALLFALVLLLLAPLRPAAAPARAAAAFPAAVYLQQEGSDTCTLAAAVMAMRARACLDGCAAWPEITEAAVRPAAWTSLGLTWSFTYEFADGWIDVGHAYLEGALTLPALADLLDAHPEGIALYCVGGGERHAVFVTDIEGETVYCADPAEPYANARRTLDSSLLGERYGDQDAILKRASAYWYVAGASFGAPGTRAPFDPLSRGRTGADVSKLQRRLIDLGYGADVGSVDGVFGPATEAALAAFQGSHGLTADGVCDAATYDALMQSLAALRGDTP